MGVEIYKNRDLKESGCDKVNFLYKEDKFYVMDNHLCAIWCWEQQINPENQYGIFHIDRHYDLLNNLSDSFLEENRNAITGTSFENFLTVKLQIFKQKGAIWKKMSVEKLKLILPTVKYPSFKHFPQGFQQFTHFSPVFNIKVEKC